MVTKTCYMVKCLFGFLSMEKHYAIGIVSISFYSLPTYFIIQYNLAV